MRIDYGKLKAAAEKTRVSRSKLSDYAAGRCRPGRKTALMLEKKLGIAPVVWLFGKPDEIKSAFNSLDI